MRDFSILYGPVRTWLAVAAVAALAVAVVMHYQGGPVADQDCGAGADCNGRLAFCDDDDPADGDGASTDCVVPTPSGLAVDPGTVEPSVEPVSINADIDGPGTAQPDDPWAEFERSGSEVPFVSLKPSEDGLTDAGQELVPTTSTVTGAPTAAAVEPRSATTIETP